MSDTLLNGQWLEPGHSLKSKNGGYEFSMQGDGKVALYSYGRCIYQNTPEQRSDIRGLHMQNDGNLCLYTKNNELIWQTDTASPKGDHTVWCVMQDDGNFVLYKNGDIPIWASNDSLPKDYGVIRRSGIGRH
ncbi:bulb-type lectin domain-containing protein [Aspergillus novoparasiticus]|uniref:Bulb-type lectin domain-containing protein n=1 Tax=Aspergillus novoparasiticus TaxID=986946 RepID=A0A5N6F6T6_9EURO|nr:bulb-type lectin domain-containing protein [Aspergillus novoparasiticus]